MLTKFIELTKQFIEENNLEWGEDGYPKFNRTLWDKLNEKYFQLYLDMYGFNGKIIRDNTNPIENPSLIIALENFKIKMGVDLPDKPSYTFFYQLNESYKELVLEDVNLFEFYNYIPNIIIYLYELGLFKIDEKYYLPFEFITKNSKDLKKLSSIEEWTILKIFKNYFYGYIKTNNPSINIESEGLDNINYLSYMIMYELYTKLGQNSIYADLDMLYYTGDAKIPEYIVKDIFQGYEIPWETSKIQNMIIFAKKKFIILNNGEINIKGFQKIKC